MAAICFDYDTLAHRILFAWDRRAENAWAGGNVAFKFAWATKNWPALVAGEASKSAELLATCRAAFEDEEEFTRVNIFDKFNEVPCAHKDKLCRRYVRQQLGIDFERFLVHGESELPSDVRARVFHEMGQLEFGGALLVFGFTKRVNSLGEKVVEPHIVEIDRYGEVTLHANFAAIGTGAVIASSTLYQREQQAFSSTQHTLYHMYEAARLAAESAPSVGVVTDYLVLDPPLEDHDIARLWRVTRKCLNSMEEVFQVIGPKPAANIPKLEDDDIFFLDPTPMTAPPAESGPVEPSDSEKSEGQP